MFLVKHPEISRIHIRLPDAVSEIGREYTVSHLGFRSLFVVAAILVALLGLSLAGSPVGVAQDASPEASPTGCPEGTPEASPEASPTTNAEGTPCPEATPSAGGGGGEEVTVESYDIYFEPREVTIPADTDVTVMLPNDGVTLHNFSIDELDIDVDIDPGATEETVINAPAGEYEYYCNVPGHKAAGMVGTLTVE